MTDLPEAVEQLAARVDALEKRVTHLEHGATAADAEPVTGFRPPAETENSASVGSVFPVLGRALLGVAGAYVLRALASSNLLPRPLIAAFAILYALGWLALAGRARASKFAAATYAATSALILAPMLWEMCLRFQVLPAGGAAAVLALYVGAATWLARSRSPAFSFAYAGGALAALALSIGTHVMVPFTLLLIAMLLVGEIAQVRRQPLAIRPLIAVAADFSAWAILFIYRTPAETRSDYPALSTAVVVAIAFLPFVVTFPGIAWRTVRMSLPLSTADIAQGLLSFAVVALALLWMLPSAGSTALGCLCVALSLGCYAATLGPFRRGVPRVNLIVGAVWSAAMMLLGIFLLFTPEIASIAFSALAIATILLADRLQCRAVELHGVLYLGVAAAISGMVVFAGHALVGQMPAAPAWPVLAAAAAATAACIVGDESPGEPGHKQFLHIIPALLAALAAVALLTHVMVRATALILSPADFHIAFLRTLTLCAVALFLAFAASRWQRLELKRVAYAALAFVAAKLIFEDLRHGHMEYTAASIGLVALTLIAVPRLAQRKAVPPVGVNPQAS